MAYLSSRIVLKRKKRKFEAGWSVPLATSAASASIQLKISVRLAMAEWSPRATKKFSSGCDNCGRTGGQNHSMPKLPTDVARDWTRYKRRFWLSNLNI